MKAIEKESNRCEEIHHSCEYCDEFLPNIFGVAHVGNILHHERKITNIKCRYDYILNNIDHCYFNRLVNLQINHPNNYLNK